MYKLGNATIAGVNIGTGHSANVAPTPAAPQSIGPGGENTVLGKMPKYPQGPMNPPVMPTPGAPDQY